MKVSIGIGGAASGRKRDFDEQVDYVVEAEKLGVDSVWSAEAWGQDADFTTRLSRRAHEAGSGSAPASCRSARACRR